MEKPMSSMEKISTYFIGGLLLLSIIIANAAIFFRYLLAHPFSWSDELIRYLFIWVIFIGAAISYRKGGLVDISILTDMAKGRASKFLNVFRHVLTFLFALIIAYQSIVMFVGELSTNEKSTALELPIWLVSFGLTVGSFLLTIYAGMNIISSIKSQEIGNIVSKETYL